MQPNIWIKEKNTTIDVRDISLNLQLVGLGIQTLGEKAFMKAEKRILTPSEKWIFVRTL